MRHTNTWVEINFHEIFNLIYPLYYKHGTAIPVHGNGWRILFCRPLPRIRPASSFQKEVLPVRHPLLVLERNGYRISSRAGSHKRTFSRQYVICSRVVKTSMKLRNYDYHNFFSCCQISEKISAPSTKPKDCPTIPSCEDIFLTIWPIKDDLNYRVWINCFPLYNPCGFEKVFSLKKSLALKIDENIQL